MVVAEPDTDEVNVLVDDDVCVAVLVAETVAVCVCDCVWLVETEPVNVGDAVIVLVIVMLLVELPLSDVESVADSDVDDVGLLLRAGERDVVRVLDVLREGEDVLEPDRVNVALRDTVRVLLALALVVPVNVYDGVTDAVVDSLGELESEDVTVTVNVGVVVVELDGDSVIV